MKNYSSYLLLIWCTLVLCSCSQVPTNLYPIYKNGKYGYIDSLGNEVIKPQYLYASYFNEGIALIIVDTTCVILSDTLTSKKASSFINLLSEQKKIRYKYGYISLDNKLAIDTTLIYEFENIENDWNSIKELISKGKQLNLQWLSCSDDRILYQDSITKLFGYMNSKGETIITPQYKDGYQFTEGLATVQVLNKGLRDSPKWGYIDINGNLVIESKYSSASTFRESKAIVEFREMKRRDDGKFSFTKSSIIINKSGKIIGTPFNMTTTIYPYNDGIACTYNHLGKLNLGYNFIDENGNYLIDGTLIDITRFGNGYAGVKIDSTNWVFVDKRMNIISEEYEEVKPFKENYAAIKKDNLWGYIDTTFQVKIPCKYDNCSSFKKGLASFEIKREALMIEGYINKRGEVVWQKEYSNWD